MRLPESVWQSYFKFTIERNPWDKCVSRYFHSKLIYETKYKKELTFEAWFSYFLRRLEQPWKTHAFGSEAPYNWPRYTCIKTDTLLIDHVIQYEYLYDELHQLCRRWNIPFKNFETFRAKNNFRTKREHYRSFYSHENKPFIDKIAHVFQKEITQFNYQF